MIDKRTLYDSALASRHMTAAGVPDNILQSIMSISDEMNRKYPHFKEVWTDLTKQYPSGSLEQRMQSLCQQILQYGRSNPQSLAMTKRDIDSGNATFAAYAAACAQSPNTNYWTVSRGTLPYPPSNGLAKRYAASIIHGNKGVNKRMKDLDRTIRSVDATALSDGTNAVTVLEPLFKLCYEGTANVDQKAANTLNNALAQVAANINKSMQTPDHTYVSDFLAACLNASYTSAWLKQSYPNPKQYFIKYLGKATLKETQDMLNNTNAMGKTKPTAPVSYDPNNVASVLQAQIAKEDAKNGH